MPYRLAPFADVGLTPDVLSERIRDHEESAEPRYERLWAYYRNPVRSPTASGPVGPRLAQSRGLPARLVDAAGAALGLGVAALDARGVAREIVIENDIAWRIHTMVDFMFGRPITLMSAAPDAARARLIERVLDAVWEASGGIGLLQDTGLLGHVYGHVDLLVRAPDLSLFRAPDRAESDHEREARVLQAAASLRIEVIDPARGIAVQSPADYRVLDVYVLRIRRDTAGADAEAPEPRTQAPAALRRWLRSPASAPQTPRASVRERVVTEIFSASSWQRYEDDGDGARLVAEGDNAVSPGVVPVVHIQNISQPFRYEGLGEVEPLIPLQDELNTRLSDRASRVTMQSFKMYLAKGIEGFDRVGVGPGRVWMTDNPDASVEAFGGSADAPGEDNHIEQIREAMDKTSGVPPLASGVVRAKIGNLTSENALRVTLMGLLSKTARKRVTYGRGIVQVCGMLLSALDRAGVFETDPAERGVRVEWPDPLPTDRREELSAAQSKIELGVPAARVLSELGYAPTDAGIT